MIVDLGDGVRLYVCRNGIVKIAKGRTVVVLSPLLWFRLSSGGISALPESHRHRVAELSEDQLEELRHASVHISAQVFRAKWKLFMDCCSRLGGGGSGAAESEEQIYGRLLTIFAKRMNNCMLEEVREQCEGCAQGHENQLGHVCQITSPSYLWKKYSSKAFARLDVSLVAREMVAECAAERLVELLDINTFPADVKRLYVGEDELSEPNLHV